jgi:hypothetical protein
VKRALKFRRTLFAVLLLVAVGIGVATHPEFRQVQVAPAPIEENSGDAFNALQSLEVKGRAPKTGYSRDQFGGDWAKKRGCDTRNSILARDLTTVVTNEKCQVISGTLQDAYTGNLIQFQRGDGTSDDVQIDHVVALSDAWQKGVQQLTPVQREELANDPLELLAVDGLSNQQKSDGDAATWLPPNKAFRCQYVARQVAVKKKYSLWVTQAEKDAIAKVLTGCSGQSLP